MHIGSRASLLGRYPFPGALPLPASAAGTPSCQVAPLQRCKQNTQERCTTSTRLQQAEREGTRMWGMRGYTSMNTSVPVTL
eukprot:1156924-Pelagomonas_calceolata.AAC.5